MTKTRIEQFFDDNAEALEAYNAKHAPEPMDTADFNFETDQTEDDDLEDGFDWLDDDDFYRPRDDFNNSDSDQISWSPGVPRP